MPALPDLQRGFAAAVLRRADPAVAAPHLAPADGRLERRLAVYRVNARENFAAALAAAYPVLRRQLGAEEFASLAWSYQQRHPSPSGNLHEISRRLPGFLAAHLPGTAEEYLADLARLEWAVQEAMGAADCAGAFDPRDLAAVPAELRPAVRFAVHPSVRVLETAFPVFGLWRDHQAAPGADGPPAAAPARGVQRLLVRRSGHGVELHPLDGLEHACLARILGGSTLAELADAALAVEGEPDVGAVLARWAALGVITGLVAPADDAR